jgi:ribosome-associated protein
MAKKKASPVKKAVKKTAVKKSSAKKAVKKKVSPAKKVVKKSAPKKAVKDKKPLVKVTGLKKVAVKPAPAEKKAIKDKVQLLADAAVEGILELKGRNITIMNLKKIHNRVCDYYIICQADSNTQVNAIAGSVEEMVKKKTGERPYRSEGFQNSEWILVDYVTVVVHIFQTQIRNFYNLESLWADAEITELAFD